MTEVSPEPIYLGDGVYAEFDGYQVWLWLLTGERIALEPPTFHALIKYGKQIGMDAP